MRKAFITGVGGAVLTPEEGAFLAEERPAGLILFSRNCVSRDQIRSLVDAFKSAIGTDEALVLIDQEGGKVQRLRPPLARLLPPASAYMVHFGSDLDAACRAAGLVARLAADDLTGFDIDTSCAPVLDIPVDGAHDIIGSRAYGRDVPTVIALGKAVAHGLISGGVLPVMKHIPGHGRAKADSHLELPTVSASADDLRRHDFEPFKSLSHLPAAMTAHVLYSALDAADPASTSRFITGDIIRRELGFDGLLMSDDLSMKALDGSLGDRARRVIAAGSDVALHCNGDLGEMREVAAAVPLLDGAALRRFGRALAVARGPRSTFDRQAAQTMVDRLLSPVT